MTHRALEFHDSKFKALRYNKAGDVQIMLDKVIVHEANKPGSESGKVFTQQMCIIVTSPAVEQNSSQVDADLYDGWISVDDKKFDNVVPLPFKYTGKIRVMLALAHKDEKILVNGTAIEIVAIGDAKYLEEFK